MKFTVIGKSISSFVSRQTGEVIDNSRLYLTCPFAKNTGDVQTWGIRCIDVRAPEEDIKDVTVNETVLIDFDEKGHYQGLERLNAPEPTAPPTKEKK